MQEQGNAENQYAISNTFLQVDENKFEESESSFSSRSRQDGSKQDASSEAMRQQDDLSLISQQSLKLQAQHRLQNVLSSLGGVQESLQKTHEAPLLLLKRIQKYDQVAKMKKAHEDNSLEVKNQSKSAKEFLSKVMYEVELHKLYEVMASCQFKEDSDFCPVMVKINHSDIIEYNNGLEYLLQVWTIHGVMVFEKPLSKPVATWNICGDKLLFQEDSLEGPYQVYLVKLFLDKQPIVFKVSLPERLDCSQTNATQENQDDEDFDRLSDTRKNLNMADQSSNGLLTDVKAKKGGVTVQQKITEKTEAIQHTSFHQDVEYMRNLGEDVSDFKQGEKQRSVSQIFNNKLITRAPKKLIDYMKGYLLVVKGNLIIYANIETYRIDTLEESKDEVVEIDLNESALDYINLNSKFRIIALQDLGILNEEANLSYIVLEEIKTRQIRFLEIEKPQVSLDRHKRSEIKLVQLGIQVSGSKMTPSPLIKYRSVSKVSPETHRRYQIGLVLRENGRFEVYSDFILVNQYFNPSLQCVDMETDFDQFYLKFVQTDRTRSEPDQPVTEYTEKSELVYQIRQVRHYWRNRVSFSTLKETKVEKWRWIIHRRISKYFRLYSSIVNFSMYMLVSHRNMISIYDMSKEKKEGDYDRTKFENVDQDDQAGDWVFSRAFDEGHVRLITVKKQPKEQRMEYLQRKQNSDGSLKFKEFDSFWRYQVCAFVGSHTYYSFSINQKQSLLEVKDKKKMPGRIISIHEDQQYRNGFILMTDQASEMSDFVTKSGCRIFQFPLKPLLHNPILELYALKFGKAYKILSSQDNSDNSQGKNCHKCLAYDSQFYIMQADKYTFFGENGDEDDKAKKVKKSRKSLARISILYCSSALNNSSVMFPIIKQKHKGKKTIKNFDLITDKQIIRKIDINQGSNQDGSKLLLTNFIPKNNNNVQVTDKDLKFYDQDMNLKLTYEGFEIRGCEDTKEQEYLYTIEDTVWKRRQSVVDHTVSDEQQGINIPSTSPSGFYIYDLHRLSEGKVEKYKLTSAIGGQSNLINRSRFGERFSFIQSLDTIVVIPFPHMNLIRCVGMDHKLAYRIWREKNGFFTALDRQNNLLTWSNLTGKLLYREQSDENLKGYEIYSADQQDITYTRDFYNLEDYSISLLKNKQVVNEDNQSIERLFKSQMGLQLNKGSLQNQLKRHSTMIQTGAAKLDKNVNLLDQDLFSAEKDDLDIKVVNSQHQTNINHFKVMKLRTHEDTKDKSECTLLFHFFFELIKKSSNKSQQSEWHIAQNPQHRLYLSKDTTRLMEVINNYTATVYKRHNIDNAGHSVYQKQEEKSEADQGQQVKWKIAYRISRFPHSIAKITSVPYLFSPNFEFQFDFIFARKQFVIRQTKTQFVYLEVPKDLFSARWQKQEGLEALQLICSRFKWISDRMFKVINIANLDCIFEMIEEKGSNKPVLKLRSVAKIDNLHENIKKLDSPNIVSDRRQLKTHNVIARLIRRNQAYKLGISHALNLNDSSYKLLHQINKIDFSQKWSEQNSSFDVELSFTWLDWRIMDILRSKADFVTENFSDRKLLQLGFNILPKGRSMLHILTKSQDEESDQIVAIQAATDLFRVYSQHWNIKIVGTESTGCSFELPVLPGMTGTTPLDTCLGIQKGHLSDIFVSKFHAQEKAEKAMNIAMAEVIFKGITPYGFMHSSFFTIDAVNLALSLGLESIKDYLESRLQSVEHCFEAKTLNGFSKTKMEYSPSMGEFGKMHTKIWAPESQIKNELFDVKKALVPMNLLYLDVPFVYSQTDKGYEFIYALRRCQNNSIFDLKSIQMLIDHQQDVWWRKSIYFVGLPMFIQLITFSVWSNIILPNLFNKEREDEPTLSDIDRYCRGSMTTIAIYLIMIELLAWIRRGGFEYLKAPSRFFNLVTPGTILLNVYMTDSLEEPWFWTIQTWAALTIWMRFLLYLRAVSLNYGYMVRMITGTVRDMVPFLMIFFFGVCAFADAFESITFVQHLNGNLELPSEIEGANFYQMYFQQYVITWQRSFLVALGTFPENLDSFREMDWLVFLICCIFNIIVLLNLLISIISETYTRYSDVKDSTSFKEKVFMMSLMQDSVFGWFVKSKSDPTELIFAAKVIEKIDRDSKVLSEQISLLREELAENNQQIREEITQSEERIMRAIQEQRLAQ